MSGSHVGGGRIAVFGDGGPPSPRAPPPASPPAPARQDPFAAPSEQELIRRIIEATRVVDERSARISGMLQDLTKPRAGADVPIPAHAESDVHDAYMQLSDALYAQRRAAVLLCRARAAAAGGRPTSPAGNVL